MKTLATLLSAAVLLGGCTQIGLINSTGSTQALAQQASQGDREAQYRMGLHFTTGADTSQNYALGLKYFQQAAEQDHTDAQYMLGMGYYIGRGAAQDYKKARTWLERAAQDHHREAMHYLGEIYYNGYGTTAERAWGAHWFGQSAEMGYSESQYLSGVSHLTGLGNTKSRREGTRWLRIASTNGSLRAKEMLEQLNIPDRKQSFTAVTSGLDSLRKRYRIRYVQFRLNKLGYSAGTADGIWGDQTARAGRAFMGHDAPLTELIAALRSKPEKR